MAGGKHRHPQVHLRIPDDLKTWVKKKADAEEISVNAAFVNCLKKLKKIEEMSA